MRGAGHWLRFFCFNKIFANSNKSVQMASDSDEGDISIFQEPSDFYEPEKEATFASHLLLTGKELKLRLVGHNPLWVRH